MRKWVAKGDLGTPDRPQREKLELCEYALSEKNPRQEGRGDMLEAIASFVDTNLPSSKHTSTWAYGHKGNFNVHVCRCRRRCHVCSCVCRREAPKGTMATPT